MNKTIILIIILILVSINPLATQNTVGLISYDPMKSFDGYNLMFPHNQSNVFLLNNCGEIVNEWTDDANWRPGNIAYITEDGLLYKAKRDASVVNDPIWAGGGGAILEIRDWDNNLIWDFEMNDSIYRLHHDFSVMPNGNIIALAWELKTTNECIAAGRDTSTLARSILWPDWVFEIDPLNDSIVWEWHTWDHLIQDFDSTKANFGVISEHPELIDVNYGRPDGHPDWHHGNSLDYNPELRQIMLSIPYFDEIWIIDHTTTTEQASGHTGGWSNRGGDLMFRWGNPRTYQKGDTSDQKLYFEHDAHWIDDFLDFGHPYYGKVAVFNNRYAADYSVAHILTPEFLDYGWMYNMENGIFTPKEVDMTFLHPDTFPLYSTGLSSIQILPNNNTLITSGRHGYTFELTPDNDIVWEYITPLKGGSAVNQGDTTLTINNNLTFRMKRYPSDFEGFEGKDLNPKGWIELDPDTTFCDNLVAVEDLMIDQAFKVYPNPVDKALTVEWDGMKYARIEIYNIQGILQSTQRCSGGRKFLDVSTLHNGIYFISIRTADAFYSRKFVIQH